MEGSVASRYEQRPVQHYAREVRSHLPPRIFEPATSRLWWLPVHLGIIGALAVYVVSEQPPWPLALVCALVSGHSWGCLGFLAHEALHHAVVKNRLVEKLVGYCGFGIYGLSP